MSLEDWQKFGWLKAHKTNRGEIAELVGIADRDIKASGTESLHYDWRFNIAYNAALQLANAALAASGYRVEHGGNQHYRAIDSLSLTLGTDSGTIRKFEMSDTVRTLKLAGGRLRPMVPHGRLGPRGKKTSSVQLAVQNGYQSRIFGGLGAVRAIESSRLSGVSSSN